MKRQTLRWRRLGPNDSALDDAPNPLFLMGPVNLSFPGIPRSLATPIGAPYHVPFTNMLRVVMTKQGCQKSNSGKYVFKPFFFFFYFFFNGREAEFASVLRKRVGLRRLCLKFNYNEKEKKNSKN